MESVATRPPKTDKASADTIASHVAEFSRSGADEKLLLASIECGVLIERLLRPLTVGFRHRSGAR